MSRRPSRGAALLSALLIMTLVATFSVAALWQQWQQVEIESAERGHNQAAWLMTGALDWTRLILREDALSAQSGGSDHLGEPWAVPVLESRLSTFLAQDRQERQGDPEVFLSGVIVDAQSRLNASSLWEDGQISPAARASWTRLFELLGLPAAELNTLLMQWALLEQGSAGSDTRPGQAPERALRPQNTAQLVWLGLSPATVRELEPYVTVLPEATPVNLNTAPEMVLRACLGGLDAQGAQQFIARRSRTPPNTLEDARQALGPAGQRIEEKRHAIRSSYFEVTGRLRIDDKVQQERALLKRENGQVRMIWRKRTHGLDPVPTLK